MRKVTIVGCGLVGSLWAYLLKKQGYDVDVFEKRPDPREKEEQVGRSINLVVTSRGLHALETAGLLEKIMAICVPVYGRRIHQKNGENFFQAYGRDNTECNYSVSRAQLNKTLIEQCISIGVKINFDHTVSGLNLKSKTLEFSSSEKKLTHNYDLLFATEGAGSVIRNTLASEYPYEFSEKTSWLDSGYKELFMPAAVMGQRPLEQNSLHIWPRGTHMMMGLANLDGSFTMTLYLPNKGLKNSLESLNQDAEIETFFKSEFSTALPLMPDYLKDYKQNPKGALGTVKMNKWTFGDSVALMGDAAHAIVPFFGQGMNLGFEDCTTLLSLLKIHNENWAETLSAFDQFQRPNANAIAEMALENFIEMRDKVSDPAFQFNKKIETIIEKEFPDLYRSRYGLITYTLVPYAVAQEAGTRQAELLTNLASGLTEPEQLDLSYVKKLLESDFSPWLKGLGYTTERYVPAQTYSTTI